MPLPEDLDGLNYSDVIGVVFGIDQHKPYYTFFDRNAPLAGHLESRGYIRPTRDEASIEPKYRDWVLTEKGLELAEAYKQYKGYYDDLAAE